MKKLISHLPENKQSELVQLVAHIQQAAKEIGSVEIIILYGSYARGDYVDKDITTDGHITYEYTSDFDIFVITKKPTQEKNMRLSRKIQSTIRKDKNITTPVSIIIEDIHHINAKLEENRYFYLDIKKEGIVLYDSGKYTLADARELTLSEKKTMQKEDYVKRFWGANTFFKHYTLDYYRNSLNIGAFNLHQATERYITAYLLVKTGYKPKTHDLKILYHILQETNSDFTSRFDLENGNDVEDQHFELLQKAYVDARYDKQYHITKEELKYLEKKVLDLQNLVQTLCEQEIEKQTLPEIDKPLFPL